jgi:hypothetical protein
VALRAGRTAADELRTTRLALEYAQFSQNHRRFADSGEEFKFAVSFLERLDQAHLQSLLGKDAGALVAQAVEEDLINFIASPAARRPTYDARILQMLQEWQGEIDTYERQGNFQAAKKLKDGLRVYIELRREALFEEAAVWQNYLSLAYLARLEIYVALDEREALRSFEAAANYFHKAVELHGESSEELAAFETLGAELLRLRRNLLRETVHGR